MSFTSRTRHLLLSLAVVTASILELVLGARVLVVLICAATFLAAGNLIIYLFGWKERAQRRRQKLEYYAGNS